MTATEALSYSKKLLAEMEGRKGERLTPQWHTMQMRHAKVLPSKVKRRQRTNWEESDSGAEQNRAVQAQECGAGSVWESTAPTVQRTPTHSEHGQNEGTERKRHSSAIDDQVRQSTQSHFSQKPNKNKRRTKCMNHSNHGAINQSISKEVFVCIAHPFYANTILVFCTISP